MYYGEHSAGSEGRLNWTGKEHRVAHRHISHSILDHGALQRDDSCHLDRSTCPSVSISLDAICLVIYQNEISPSPNRNVSLFMCQRSMRNYAYLD